VRVWIEEHGGAIITGAFVIVLIVAVTAWGKTDAGQTMFTGLMDKFAASATAGARVWGLNKIL